MSQDFIFEILKNELEGSDLTPTKEEIGKVVASGDGVAHIEGLSNVMLSEIVEISKWPADDKTPPVPALILNLEEFLVGAVVLGKEEDVKEGDIVKRTGKVLSIPAGEWLLGKVVDPLGRPLKKNVQIPKDVVYLPIERPAPSIMDREPVRIPVTTGVKIVDSTIPIGRGQRELILGDRQTGKTALAIDTIINQKNEPPESRPICVYVAIGQKYSKIAQIVNELESKGAMEYTIVVVAGASDPVPLWYIAPYAACSMGEYFRDRGKDVVIIYDDLTKHAWAWRQMSLLLRRPPGREAYPGDIFYLHSRLLERAAKLSKQAGGGSLTALPIAETQLGDISTYIPTNLISITDGQIYLDSDLFLRGQRPAVHLGLSVSRVGSATQAKAMKKVAAKLKLELAQYKELESFSRVAQDLDEATKKRLERGARLTELLKQEQFRGMQLEEQACSIFAGISGYMDKLPISKIQDFEKKFLAYLKTYHGGLLTDIQSSKDITDESNEKLNAALKDFASSYE